jgi:transcriptional regulator with GAF, ATPase, and Fis domain
VVPAWQSGQRESTFLQIRERWYRIVADPVLDDNGQVTAVVLIISDITERERTEEELLRRNHELTLLHQAVRACTSFLDPTQVLWTVLKETCALLDVISSSVWLIDPGERVLICQDATGPNRETLRGWRVPVGQGIVGRVASTGESVVVADTRDDSQFYAGVDQATGTEIRSIIGVPLKIQDQVTGVLEVVDTDANRLKETDLRLLEPLAAAAATAVENARLYQRAQQEIAERKRAETAREQLIVELQDALAQVRTLTGLLPMCASCKKIRDDQGYWQAVEVYIREHSDADFSHGLCPDCAKKLYPDIFVDEDFSTTPNDK